MKLIFKIILYNLEVDGEISLEHLNIFQGLNWLPSSELTLVPHLVKGQHRRPFILDR